MGKLKYFDKIEFTPFKYRVGNIEVRNFIIGDDGNITTLNSQNYKNLSHYEIVKWSKNNYFGNENNYELVGGFYREKNNKNSISVHPSCFKNPETCYTLAYWVNMDHDECYPDLKFVGARPFDLNETETLVFMNLAKATQIRMNNELENGDSES